MTAAWKRQARALTLSIVALTALVGATWPLPAHTKPLCGRVALSYANGILVGAHGYTWVSCGCFAINWGSTTPDRTVVHEYCPD